MKHKITKKQVVNKIKNVLLNEISAYHGTRANFDKFDHRHYLSTGCGSQAFGWGTYVTDDIYIGKSYAKDEDYVPRLLFDDEDISNPAVEYNFINFCVKTYGLRTSYIKSLYRMFKPHNNDFKSIECQLIENIKNEKKFYDSQTDENEKSISLNHIKAEKEKLNCFKSLLKTGKLKLENKQHYLYTVEIPDDNGTNYIDWYGILPNNFMYRILDTFSRLKPKYLEMICKNNYPFAQNLGFYLKSKNRELLKSLSTQEGYTAFFGSNLYSSKKDGNGLQVYRRLSDYLGSDKAASLFLMNAGFVGIKYKAGTIWEKPDKASDNAYNYVIFNANNVKITNKEEV